MNKKIIGISPRFSIHAGALVNYLKINSDYLQQILNRNGFPLVLIDEETLDETLPQCDGILIIGGDDIDPKYYNENNDKQQSKDIDEYTDRVDQKIITYAVEHGIPTLGICRGLQAMAAFLGGSLHQDIKDAGLNHPSEDKKHQVTRVNSTILTDLLPDSFLVNTYHHQAIKNVPDGFIVTYMNHDVIEAIEHKALPILGVQWHPERFYTKESEIIFDYFFKKIDEYGKNK